jgi:hypothetical protein
VVLDPSFAVWRIGRALRTFGEEEVIEFDSVRADGSSVPYAYTNTYRVPHDTNVPGD